jgi:FkbM family methyltransferase
MVLEEIFSQAEYEPVRKWNLPGDAKIFDLGANIGLASLYFASLFPKSKIVAVEPDEGNCTLMRRNCRRLIDQDRITVHRAFAAGSDGVAGLEAGFDHADNVARQAWAFAKSDKVDERHVAVPCLSIPSLLQSSGFDQVDLFKCDIEGSEKELFKDCQSWIGRIGHLIVETHNSWSDPNERYPVTQLYADLRNAGWDFEVLYELQEDLVGIAFLKKKQSVPPTGPREQIAAPGAGVV